MKSLKDFEMSELATSDLRLINGGWVGTTWSDSGGSGKDWHDPDTGISYYDDGRWYFP